MSAAIDVLIAGGGLAAQRCCETLRRDGFDGRIVVCCEEPEAPYDRPPLSKDVLTGARDPHALSFRPARWYAEHDVELLLGAEAGELLGAERVLALVDGKRLRYRNLVIATGSRPRRLSIFGAPDGVHGEGVHELRTRDDAEALRDALTRGCGTLAIAGAGLVGLEVASSASSLGVNVTVVEAAAAPLGRALPPQLGSWLAGLHRRHGVDVRLATTIERLDRRAAGGARLTLSDGGALRADTVLLAAGTAPATEWLASSPLGPGAVVTDAGGRTSLAGVFAAGDAASYPDPHTGEHRPSQHWEAAARQGATVARTILGLAPCPAQPPMFWTDQHGLRIQLVGHAPADCTIELDGELDGEDFAAWLVAGGLTTAAMLVNRPRALPLARARIAAEQAGIQPLASAA
jgi:3-phenylpropionate/trans-cinnamate dioxygenase ferredoxin reductase component